MGMIRTVLSTGWFAFQVVAIVFVLNSFAFAQNYIPSESMVPTLEVGDRLFTDKTAYGWSRYSMTVDPGVRFAGENGRIAGAVPNYGDVVTFTHPHDKETYIKRVIALPGDRIALENGRLFINGKLIPREFKEEYAYRKFKGPVVQVAKFDEILPGGVKHTIIEQTDSGFGDYMAEKLVPAGHIFVMGDNRDNSSDSRFNALGFVPIENIQGRARIISYSLYSCEDEPNLRCAKRPLFSPIH